MQRKKTFSYLLSGAMVAVAGVVVVETVRGFFPAKPPVDPRAALSAIPADVRNPALGEVKLAGKDLDAFLARKPMRPGSAAPRIATADFRRRLVQIPAKDGKPTVGVVSCGCMGCGSLLHDLLAFRREMGPQFHALGIVATTSEYAWGHHAGTFALQEEITLVHDEEGKLRRQFRPAGDHPTRLPLVWVADGKGVIRHVAQPEPDADWRKAVQASLRLKPPPPPSRPGLG